MKNEKTMEELICDVAKMSDETASQLPHWARVLKRPVSKSYRRKFHNYSGCGC